jgi:hypothetical protein
VGTCPMGKRFNPLPPALKHGAYSGVTLLPGESPDDFRKLHDRLIAEYSPIGPSEEDVVATMAMLIWRKQNLSTYRLAELAKQRYKAICAKYSPRFDLGMQFLLGKDERSEDQIRADTKAAEEEIRSALGDLLALVEMGDAVTIDQLLKDLALIDRINGMLDRCHKRLLMERGVKSISLTAAESSSDAPKQLPAA